MLASSSGKSYFLKRGEYIRTAMREGTDGGGSDEIKSEGGGKREEDARKKRTIISKRALYRFTKSIDTYNYYILKDITL